MVEHPVLSPFTRYRWDSVREEHQLVFPEGLLKLNDTGAAIVRRCDGRSVDSLVESLAADYPQCRRDEVIAFLENMQRRGLLRDAFDS